MGHETLIELLSEAEAALTEAVSVEQDAREVLTAAVRAREVAEAHWNDAAAAGSAWRAP